MTSVFPADVVNWWLLDLRIAFSYSPAHNFSAVSFSISSSSCTDPAMTCSCSIVLLLADVTLVDCVTAEPLLPQLDVICVQVGSFGQSSPPMTSLSRSVCVSGWWSNCSWQEIMSAFLINWFFLVVAVISWLVCAFSLCLTHILVPSLSELKMQQPLWWKCFL